MTEQWRPVVGHEDDYEVSDLGRVRSKDRTRTYRHVDHYSGKVSEVARQHKGRVLRPGPSNSGHLSVILGRGNMRLVHVLVLEAFVGPRPKGCDGCHWDDNPANNALTNLRWATRSENIHDAIRNGGKSVGEGMWNAKLTWKAAEEIRAAQGTIRPCDLARKYGVNEATIRQVFSGRTWKDRQNAI